MFLAYPVQTRPLFLAFILYLVASGNGGWGRGLLPLYYLNVFIPVKLGSKNIWSFCTWLLCVMNSIFRYKGYI